MRVCEYQIPEPFSFGGGPTTDERPLSAPALGAVRRLAKVVRDKDYHKRMVEAIDLGAYTTHDPETLHPRFLNYVHERVESVDKVTTRALALAQRMRVSMWKDLGLNVKARPLSDATPLNLLPQLKSGSPGEFRSLGAVNRREPRLVETMSASLMRYGEVGRLVSIGKKRA